MPSTSDVVPFSSFLICSQLRITSAGLVGDDVAEHVRVPAHELVVDAARDVGHGERAGLLREHRVEHDLVEEVAELVLERRVPGRRQVLDRLDHLVRLLEEVAGERVVGLLGVPRAPARVAQPLGELERAAPARAPRHRTGVDEQRGEVVGLDRTRSSSASATTRDAARRGARGAAAR